MYTKIDPPVKMTIEQAENHYGDYHILMQMDKKAHNEIGEVIYISDGGDMDLYKIAHMLGGLQSYTIAEGNVLRQKRFQEFLDDYEIDELLEQIAEKRLGATAI
jgi:hypothetical protein